ncbi:MAG: tannase/feruloyl esterase family alpha/beta hydrolase, partial [Thermaurantiacus sp.]
RAAGGKIVLFHGAGDPVFSIRDTDTWFEKLSANAGAELDGFIRYYRIAGMPHGASGPTADGFDFFASLTDWVEKGEAPGAVIASVTDGNKEGIAALGKVTRKLCPHPQVARYTGSDPALAESFTCQ